MMIVMRCGCVSKWGFSPMPETRPHEAAHYKRYDEWLDAACELGFSSVDEAIKSLYVDKGLTSAKTGYHLGERTGAAIRYHFPRLGILPRPKGGANNTKGRPYKHIIRGTPLVKYCQQHRIGYSTVMMRMKAGQGLLEAVEY